MNNQIDPMLEIIKCPCCGKQEYYGAMIWKNGKQECRRCAYARWQKETNYKWEPKITDYVFPIYVDGIDYEQK